MSSAIRDVTNCYGCPLSVSDGCFVFCCHPNAAEEATIAVDNVWRAQLVNEARHDEICGLPDEDELEQRPPPDACPLRTVPVTLVVT